MIIILEQDLTVRNGHRFSWRPYWFSGKWDGRRTWRLAWGIWSVSWYPSTGLRAFFDRVESGATEWKR